MSKIAVYLIYLCVRQYGFKITPNLVQDFFDNIDQRGALRNREMRENAKYLFYQLISRQLTIWWLLINYRSIINQSIID